MEKNKIKIILKQFDDIIQNNEEYSIEFWYARDLMPLLGYERWENFDKAVNRAIESCKASNIEISDHFREVTKMVKIGSNTNRKVKDYMLTRYYR